MTRTDFQQLGRSADLRTAAFRRRRASWRGRLRPTAKKGEFTLRFQYDTLLHALSATKLRVLLRVLYEHSDSPFRHGVIPANCRLIPVPRVLAREQGRTLRSGQVGRGPRGAEPRPVPTQL